MNNSVVPRQRPYRFFGGNQPKNENQAVGKKENLQSLVRTGDLKIQVYPYSLALYQLSYPEVSVEQLCTKFPKTSWKRMQFGGNRGW